MTTAVRTPPHHDTLTCYTDYQCRLPVCVARARAYEAERRNGQANGTWQPLVDATDARNHLLKLYAAGITVYRVATITGLSDHVVRGITQPTRSGQRIDGRRYRLTPQVAEKILAVNPEVVAPAKVSPVGSIRRIQALAAIGWSTEGIARRTGISGQTMYYAKRQTLILSRTATRISDAYDKLSRTRPTRRMVNLQQSNTARNRAAANGWPPPSYWRKVGCIDDPEFQPEYGVTKGQILAENARWLMAINGMNRDQVAQRLGETRDNIDTVLRRYPDPEQAAA